MQEIWRKIEGWERYEVSNYGQVRSLWQNGKGGSHPRKSPLLKKSCLSVWGYPEVRLWQDSRSKKFRLHRLVAQAFLTNPLNKSEVNHKDGNKENNVTFNLEWVTRGENMEHLFRVTKSPTMRGERNGHARLTKHDVNEIKDKWLSGSFRQKDIAEEYDIARSTVNAIVNGYNWKNLTTT